MTKSYLQCDESRELQILSALSDCSATEEQIQEVVNDINSHLSTATGTLQNYNGRFKKAGLKALQDNYQLFTNEEYYTAVKVGGIYNSLTSRILEGEKVSVPPATIKMIIDYMKGEETRQDAIEGIKYVTIGYEYAEGGNFSLPDSKLPKK